MEALTTAVLLGLLCTIAATLLHSESMVVRNTSDHIATGEALGSARMIVTAELRNTAPNDVRALGRDSIALRVFRGRGIVCARGPESVHFRYSGLREPNPDKDSLLIVGSEQTAPFQLSSERQLCTLSPPEERLADPAAVRTFPHRDDTDGFYIARQ